MNIDTLGTKVLEGAISGGSETDKIHLNDPEKKPCQAREKNPAPAKLSWGIPLRLTA
jgi:multimeric flavodoxin WrbA